MPTSRSRAPVDSISSGSRNPSPISTSSPRLTTISRPAASAVAASSSAAAPLLTTCTPPAVGHRRGQRGERAAAAPGPATGGQVELDVGGAAGGHHRVDGGRRQRRPAEVGVHDDAGRVDAPAAGSPRSTAARRRRASATCSGAISPGACPLLRLGDNGLHQRAAEPRSAAASRGSASSTSVRGTRRRGSAIVERSDEACMAEADGNRTRQRQDLPLSVLKTGTVTRPDTPPWPMPTIMAGSMEAMDRYRLTQYAHGGGCACKIPPGELEDVVRGLTRPRRGIRSASCSSGSTTATTRPWCGSTDGHGADRDDRLLHPGRRRRLRLGPDRGGQRAVRRLRDGRAARWSR